MSARKGETTRPQKVVTFYSYVPAGGYRIADGKAVKGTPFLHESTRWLLEKDQSRLYRTTADSATT